MGGINQAVRLFWTSTYEGWSFLIISSQSPSDAALYAVHQSAGNAGGVPAKANRMITICSCEGKCRAQKKVRGLGGDSVNFYFAPKNTHKSTPESTSQSTPENPDKNGPFQDCQDYILIQLTFFWPESTPESEN